MRHRLFDAWFSSYGSKTKYTRINSVITDEFGIDNYITLIIRNDNPQLQKIIQEFAEAIEFFNEKPQ